jgi:polysaccharide biosynthesis/export protein
MMKESIKTTVILHMKHTKVMSICSKRLVPMLTIACSILVAATGCKSTNHTVEDAAMASAVAAVQAAPVTNESLILREGDTVKINFPAAPNLNTSQAIRRDGKISLALVGEVQAAGLTPIELQNKLLEAYGPQLQTKEVTVSLESSAFPVYVTGAVLRPGKIISDRPLTALEAVMEAGGFDYNRANMKKVRIIRYVDGKQQNLTVNMKALLDKGEGQVLKLQPSDILYVPERFVWF